MYKSDSKQICLLSDLIVHSMHKNKIKPFLYSQCHDHARTPSQSWPLAKFLFSPFILLLISFSFSSILRYIYFGCYLAVRVGMLYLLSGFGGSILSSLFIQNNISVGASGALFGLLGAMLSELITNWTVYSKKVWY